MKAVLIACVLLFSLTNPAEGHRIVNTDNRAEGAAVAQSPSWTKVEHRPIKAEGVGSNPTSGPSSAQPQPRLGRWRGFCSTWVMGEFLTPARWAENPVKGRREMVRLVTCVFEHFGLADQVPHALYVADRESSFYPFAQNPSSLCSGIWQHVLSAWPGRAVTYLKRWEFSRSAWLPNWSDPRANTIVAARMVADPSIQWGPWGG